MTTFLLSAICFTLPEVSNYDARNVEGWKVNVSRVLLEENAEVTESTIRLIGGQLRDLKVSVPSAAVQKLTSVQIWISPPYEGFQPTAEYHPSEEWLKKNERNPAMVKGIEFTNSAKFAQESRRMPNLVLHELAHAYHDQFLPSGYKNPDIERAYNRAAEHGWYEKVQRKDSEGVVSLDRAYALSNPMEYFAEATEGYFGRNDFYPFDRKELASHDPEGYFVVRKLWGMPEITAPPSWMKLDGFYQKYFDAVGYPVVSSGGVNDYALKETGYLINLMLEHRPDIKRAMVRSGSRMIVMAWNEFTSDIPEYKWLKPAEMWDRRARGLGGSETDPVCSCAEENVLGYPGDPYSTESIVIHEFAHNIHLRGLINLDKTFDPRLKKQYEMAMSQGLWKGKYAATNHHEYFAEGVQSWFDNNREPDHDHNHVNTREELIAYDPGLAEFCREVFGETVIKYTKPVNRISGHLHGYNPSSAPTFKWRSSENRFF